MPSDSTLCTPDEIAAAYGGTRRRSTELLRSVGDGVAKVEVPACPDWTVVEVVAHMCGVCDDVLAGNVEGAGTDPWTAAQVAAFDGQALSQILDHWEEVGPQVEAIIPAIPPRPTSQMVFDVTSHEHDLRDALDRPGGRDADAIRVGLGFLFGSLGHAIRTSGLAALEITAGNDVFTLGDGDPEVHLAGAPFELFRAFGGRRTLDEVRALDWSTDPSPYLDLFFGGILRPPATSLAE